MSEVQGNDDYPTVTEALYFGCWDQIGHGFHLPSGATARGAGGRLDVTPWGWGVERLTPATDERQGHASLHHKDGWTALACQDRTVDHRGNSKSVFCFDAVLTVEEAVQLARHHFPKIVRRVGEIVVVNLDELYEEAIRDR